MMARNEAVDDLPVFECSASSLQEPNMIMNAFRFINDISHQNQAPSIVTHLLCRRRHRLGHESVDDDDGSDEQVREIDDHGTTISPIQI